VAALFSLLTISVRRLSNIRGLQRPDQTDGGDGRNEANSGFILAGDDEFATCREGDQSLSLAAAVPCAADKLAAEPSCSW